MDGDGLRDILTLAQLATSADRREGRLIVHRRTSPGTYVTTQTVGFGLYPWRLATGDLDGDGRNEIVVLAGEDRYLVVQT